MTFGQGGYGADEATSRAIFDAYRDAGGNFVIAWTSAGEDNGAGTGVYAQRYSADGAALGGDLADLERADADARVASVEA